MPYVDEKSRVRLNNGGKPQNAGELNYLITKLADDYLKGKGQIRYAHINEVIGVLECAKQEFYRRIAATYEDRKISQYGDVYTNLD